jgi:hypothetical protein
MGTSKVSCMTRILHDLLPRLPSKVSCMTRVQDTLLVPYGILHDTLPGGLGLTAPRPARAAVVAPYADVLAYFASSGLATSTCGNPLILVGTKPDTHCLPLQ